MRYRLLAPEFPCAPGAMASDLKQRLEDDVKVSLKSGDKQRVAALRLVLAAIKQVEIDDRITATDDLVTALRSGQVAGAALDVTDPEPLPADHPLWQMPNVIITPHVSSNGGNSIRHMIVLRENLRRFIAGDALLNVVDPELGY